VQVDARVAPLRERLGELRLKEQAAQLNAEQFAAQLREASADEAALASAAEQALRPSALQGEITRLTQAISELGAVNLAALAYGVLAIINMVWPRTPQDPWYRNYGMIVGTVVVVATGLLYAVLFRPYDRIDAPEGDAHLVNVVGK